MSSSWHTEGWIWKGQIYCDDCLPVEAQNPDSSFDTTPIIPDSEWGTPIRCVVCSKGLNIRIQTEIPKFSLPRGTHICNTSALRYGTIMRWLHGLYNTTFLYRVKCSDGKIEVWCGSDIVETSKPS